MLSHRLILFALAATPVLGGPLVPEAAPEAPPSESAVEDANATAAAPTNGVSLEEKQVADAAAFAAEKVVTQLEVQRDAAWQTARGTWSLHGISFCFQPNSSSMLQHLHFSPLHHPCTPPLSQETWP